jgi:hypothetical protein
MVAGSKTASTELVNVITRDNLATEYRAIFMGIPEAQDDDGAAFILDALNATSLDDFNAESKLPSLDSLAPAKLKVESLVRRPSDIEGGIGWYLVVDAVDLSSGEMVRFQTSAAKPMAVLARIHQLGKLPAIIAVEKRAEATRSGMHPLQVTVSAWS